MKISPKVKSIAMRFVKAFISGAMATMAMVVPFSGNSWSGVGMWLSALAMAGFIGGITGAIMAWEKWLNWKK